MVKTLLGFASLLILPCTKTDEIMTQATIFTFPPIVTKAQLTAHYGAPADKLKIFLGDELAKNINWANTRTFGPEQSHCIYEKLSPHLYPQLLKARLEMIIKVSLTKIKNVA